MFTNETSRPMLKGLALSFVLLGLFLGVLYAVLDLWGPPSTLLAFAAAPFPVIGMALGYAAGRLRTRRFRKLFGLGVLFVYVTALGAAAIMMLGDASGRQEPVVTIIGSIFWLGSVGFVLYAFVTVPLLLLGVFVLERWTRPTVGVPPSV
ncbi:MAG: hypothetical protein NTY02_01295 [Acidobacteria bacterium]|nr:hypothetical protein [Acidobacteriota bacterium]